MGVRCCPRHVNLGSRTRIQTGAVDLRQLRHRYRGPAIQRQRAVRERRQHGKLGSRPRQRHVGIGRIDQRREGPRLPTGQRDPSPGEAGHLSVRQCPGTIQFEIHACQRRQIRRLDRSAAARRQRRVHAVAEIVGIAVRVLCQGIQANLARHAVRQHVDAAMTRVSLGRICDRRDPAQVHLAAAERLDEQPVVVRRASRDRRHVGQIDHCTGALRMQRTVLVAARPRMGVRRRGGKIDLAACQCVQACTVNRYRSRRAKRGRVPGSGQARSRGEDRCATDDGRLRHGERSVGNDAQRFRTGQTADAHVARADGDRQIAVRHVDDHVVPGAWYASRTPIRRFGPETAAADPVQSLLFPGQRDGGVC